MARYPLTRKPDYWQSFEVIDSDIEFLYNYLLEEEAPQPPEALLQALIGERIRQERQTMAEQQQAAGAVFLPKNTFQVGQTIQLPALDWQSGVVVSSRPGQNPDLPPFEVIEVELESGERRQFASGLQDHPLNQAVAVAQDDPDLDPQEVINQYGEELQERLNEALESSPELVRIAGKWFPRALLVDINVGHLNLAEAVLDMMGGGPLPTRDLMEQVDLPTDVEANLNEFSLNLAMQEDKRFDEIGPAGEVLWYLNRLEPEDVRETPLFLRYSSTETPDQQALKMLREFEPQILDELEPSLNPAQPGAGKDSVTLALIYPHWRAGTLPLAGALRKIFPTALESPRIQFTLVDGLTREKFSGWVVRPNRYVTGLREWYLAQGLVPGSLLHIQRGEQPGEVIIRYDRRRGSRDWIRTAVVGSDGGVVFSMLKHNITAAIDERTSIVVTNVETLDAIWERTARQNATRAALTSTIRTVLTELAKLSPQSHVHASELYAGVNILRRCPPGIILDILTQSTWAKHLGNLYFRLSDTSGGDDE